MSPELLPLFLTLAGVGAVAGLSAGLFGIGGGAVIVPALFYAFTAIGYSSDVTMHMAVATSAAVIVVNAIRSVRAHHSHGAVDWGLLWPRNLLQSYAMWIGAGSFIASLVLAPRLSGEILTLIFAIVGMMISLQFIFGRPDFTLREKVPGGPARPIVGSFIGGLSALMGIGGGSLTVPLMALCNVPIHRAIATASGFGFAIALPATIGFVISGWNVVGRPGFSIGYVNFLGFFFIAALAFVTIPIGAKLAHKMSQKKLKLVFGICLMFVALNMAREVIG